MSKLALTEEEVMKLLYDKGSLMFSAGRPGPDSFLSLSALLTTATIELLVSKAM